jgi:hypothetical protein
VNSAGPFSCFQKTSGRLLSCQYYLPF